MDLSNVVWRKARRSTDNGGDCIEVASAPTTVAIRDSKDPDGGNILIGRQDFTHFAKALKSL
ncbi:DUF397 domain-containing protein [Actinomadura hibisca]|uniref:DUF397 domain-containing protein n=1 Tax=Actinomadura hibisca TaxID=68565 RepID=UPI00082FDAA2|nr:DUF397 domain-containing protein [Actinomadura hibisca]